MSYAFMKRFASFKGLSSRIIMTTVQEKNLKVLEKVVLKVVTNYKKN